MRAIIVDDEAVAAAAMKRRITWQKYGIEEVLMAQSMRQAIALMEQEAVDLMLCDVEMPGGSGLELYEWVRIYRPETECVFVSCHPEYEYVRKALIMGSMDYVLKPVDYEEMDRILTEAARRIRERKHPANAVSIVPFDVSPESEPSIPQSESQYQELSANAGAAASEKKGPANAGAGTGAASEKKGSANAGAAASEKKGPANADAAADHEASAAAQSAQPIYSDAIQNAISYMKDHLEQNMSISEIADVAHLNPQYFMRLFKKETGSPVLEYLTESRLKKAMELLAQTNLPITEVALSAGYDNFSYFSKLFKRNEGITPSEYRKRTRA